MPASAVLSAEDRAAAKNAARRLIDVNAAADWRGPDPYDALWWAHWPRVLTAGRRRRQALLQSHARAPVDVRVYRRSHPRLAKALALFAQADMVLDDGGGVARRAADLLCEDQETECDGWGYPFDVQTRWSFYAAHTPNVVVTSFAGDALADASTRFGERRYSDRARAAARWVADALWVEEKGMFGYHPGSETSVHNASLLGARLVWRHVDDADARDKVRRAVERVLSRQASDGHWPYGEGPGLEFVDSFHTGFVLRCLAALEGVDPTVAPAIERGGRLYAERFFGSRGEARLWPDRARPEDGHSTGTALATLAMLGERGVVSPELCARVARRALGGMIVGGRGVHRRGRWMRSRVVYPRWVDAHMAEGLARAWGSSTPDPYLGADDSHGPVGSFKAGDSPEQVEVRQRPRR